MLDDINTVRDRSAKGFDLLSADFSTRFVSNPSVQITQDVKPSPVMIIDGDDVSFYRHRIALEKAGFSAISLVSDLETAKQLFFIKEFKLIWLYDAHNRTEKRSFEFLSFLRDQAYNGSVAMISRNPSMEDCYRAAVLGADDYLVKGSHVDIVFESHRLLAKSDLTEKDVFRSLSIHEKGLFRSLGLTANEINILSEFARDFPQLNTLAKRTGKTEVQLRKTFSRIYAKLDKILGTGNVAKLAHLVTIYSLYVLPRDFFSLKNKKSSNKRPSKNEK